MIKKLIGLISEWKTQREKLKIEKEIQKESEKIETIEKETGLRLVHFTISQESDYKDTPQDRLKILKNLRRSMEAIRDGKLKKGFPKQDDPSILEVPTQ